MAALQALIDRPLATLQLRIQHTSKGEVAWLTLNRPGALNAISMELLTELHEVLDALQHPNTMFESVERLPRVLVISGAGKAFCAGVDIKAADRGVGGQAWDYHDMRSQQLLARMIAKLRAIPQPVIAAVNGVASGGGAAIALAADCRLAVRGSGFSTSFVKLGLTGADMGTSFTAPAQLPLGIAAELMMTGRPLSAQRAHDLGLVNVLVDDAQQLAAAAEALARDMLACSPRGLQLTKEQLNAAADGVSLQAALTAENSHQIHLVNDPYAAKVAQAWLDAMLGAGDQRRRNRPHSKL